MTPWSSLHSHIQPRRDRPQRCQQRLPLFLPAVISTLLSLSLPFLLLLLTFPTATLASSFSTPPLFCKCTCGTESVIIPLDESPAVAVSGRRIFGDNHGLVLRAQQQWELEPALVGRYPPRLENSKIEAETIELDEEKPGVSLGYLRTISQALVGREHTTKGPLRRRGVTLWESLRGKIASRNWRRSFTRRDGADGGGDGGSGGGGSGKGHTCSDCNRNFCLSYNLPFCKDVQEEEVVTSCFARDGVMDRVLVLGFVIVTVGLLLWAGVRRWVTERMTGGREWWGSWQSRGGGYEELGVGDRGRR